MQDRLAVKIQIFLTTFFRLMPHTHTHSGIFFSGKIVCFWGKRRLLSLAGLFVQRFCLSEVGSVGHWPILFFHFCQKKSPKMSLEYWHFPSIFILLKLICLVTLFDRKLQVFKNSPKQTIFWHFSLAFACIWPHEKYSIWIKIFFCWCLKFYVGR